MVQPFGLEPGSTPPNGMANYHIDFETVPKPHPAFKSYAGIWKPGRGLTMILGTSERFSDDRTAIGARQLYEQVKRQLSQIYGDPDVHEFVTDEYWDDENDFCMTLGNDERFHLSRWTQSEHALDERVQNIQLSVRSDDGYEESHVCLSYSFSGNEDSPDADEFGIDSL